jgi:hypothetical protein
MMSALILAASAVALAQFGVNYWRSLIAGLAAQPLSERFFAAAGLDHTTPAAEDFAKLLGVLRLTPAMDNPSHLRAVRVYFSIVNALQVMPALRSWATAEMGTCSQYLAVVVDQRLSHNLECAAKARSC